MSLLGGHLGARASALLDGQLPAEESERAWLHVSECTECQQLVQREGWLKRRLACLGQGPAAAAPSELKGALLGGPALPNSWTNATPTAEEPRWSRRIIGLAAVSSGALGAAVMGVLTVGAAPADAPGYQPRTVPITAVGSSTGYTSGTLHVRNAQR